MAQYTNPYGQQYYGTSGASNPYVTTPGANSANSVYSQYMTTSSQYLGQPTLTSQYSQYPTTATAYQPQYYPQTIQGGIQQIRAPSIQGEAANSLWMGDIDGWMDENFIYSLFAHTGEVVNVKLIRDKQTGVPSNYAFIYFASQHAAQKVLENFNGQPIPATNKMFRLNWAQYGVGTGDKGKKPGVPTIDTLRKTTGAVPRPGTQDETISLFIGDLAPDVTDYYILDMDSSILQTKTRRFELSMRCKDTISHIDL